jgi:hypothetical protein
MSDSSGTQARPARSARLRQLGVVLAAVLLLQLGLIAAFVSASRHPSPHHVPLAVVGTPRAVAPLAAKLASTGAFSVRPEPSVAAAKAAIRHQDVYGALVPGRRSGTLLVASAASPLTAQLLTKVFTATAQANGTALAVQDVVPLPPSDPRGIAGPYLVLGMVIGGYIGAMVIGRVIGMRSPSIGHLGLRLGVLADYAVAAGGLAVVLLDPVLGVMHGHAPAIAATGALIAFAVGCFTSALQTALGLIGTLLSVVTLVVVGNPAAGGGQIPPSLLPAAWSWLAHVLPNPAGMTAVRSLEFFSGHGAGQPLLVLGVYVAVAVAVMVVMALIPATRKAPAATSGTSALTGDLAAESAPGAML